MNKTVPSHDIMKTVWGDDSIYVARSLQVFITRLRRKLVKDSSVRIVNARGIGYKLVIDIPDDNTRTPPERPYHPPRHHSSCGLRRTVYSLMESKSRNSLMY